MLDDIEKAISTAAGVANTTAREKGFWKDYDNAMAHGPISGVREAFISQKLALITSEVAEALEGLRRGDAENLGEELADIIIRTLDLGEELRFDMGARVVRKMRQNVQRPPKHGKAF
jgi:NTP pyrophosphatase (non-canonical NTP hydrolase)